MADEPELEDESFDLSELEGGGEAKPLFRYDGERFPIDAEVKVKKYDFTNPIVLSEADLDKLKTKSTEFSRRLAGHLSMFLRTEFNLTLEGVSEDLYSNFTQSIQSPSCITLFKVQELNGVCVLDVNSHLAATVVDRVLGGRGSTMPEERGLTDIEKALVQDFNYIILEEWCKQWEDCMQLHPSVIGNENSGRFLQTSPPDAKMLILTMEASFGDVTGPMRVAVPYLTLEPIVTRILAASKDLEKASSVPARWQEVYDDISVPVSAEWDAFEVTVRDLLSWRVDDVIFMPNRLLNETQLRVEGRTCFVGDVGVEGERVAFRVNESCLEVNNLTG